MSDWIISKICDVTMKHSFSLAGVWFYDAERVCFECHVVHFVDENVKKDNLNGENKGLGSIRGYFGLNILGKLNMFV